MRPVVVTPQGAPLSVPADAAGVSGSAGFEGGSFWNWLLGTILDEYCVDSGRVFATGMSNGAGMSTTLGCELGGRFAAIAPVAGVNLSGACPGDDPVSVLAIHGDADAIATYGGNNLLGF